MILYLKAGEDGKSVGDCPFGQNIRMILEEKQIKYDIRTCSTSTETKPNWLIEYYDGQLPALRHKKECYIETNIIVSYLDYFFPTSENNDENISNKSQSNKESKTNLDNAEENALGGFFPSIARYLKDVNDDDDENENETLEVLKERLDSLENHFKNLCDENEDNDNDNENNEWCYLDGSKTNFSNLDCRIIPQLYHLTVAVVEFKNGSPNLKEDYPFTYRYLNEGMKRDSFINTKYSKETIVWGWNNARQQQQQSQQLQE
jgi:chloride intracellular channel protein 1